MEDEYLTDPRFWDKKNLKKNKNISTWYKTRRKILNGGMLLSKRPDQFLLGGWPSFFKSLPNVFETKTDHLLGYPRTEYHCKKCKGHHGHIFDDGPKPSGKRYCNNGLCLTFVPKIDK